MAVCHAFARRTLAVVCCLAAWTVQAQCREFGRNKVQYATFDFKVRTSDHFSTFFYPEEDEKSRDALRMAERWYARHSSFFGHAFKKKNPLIFYASDADFQQTNVVEENIGQGTGGLTEGLRERVVIPLNGTYADTDHVIGHELVHVFQYQIIDSTGTAQGSNANSLPLWFIEGMAEYLSLGRCDSDTAMWLRDALLRDKLPDIETLSTDPEYFPYRWGQALWAYIAGVWGDEMVSIIYVRAVRYGWEEAMTKSLGMPLKELSRRWKDAVLREYGPLIAGRTRPKDLGRRLAVKSRMSVCPVLSPNGTAVAFFSQRDVFSTDLYVADARSGKIIRKLSSYTRNGSVEALRFIDSAGTWSPDGAVFAAVVFSKGRNGIAFFNVRTSALERELSFGGLSAITNPAWSPDGKKLAFSGSAGGITDLYLYDLENAALTRLTDDKYAELQPAWSPDGKTLAFVTDRREGTDFGRLTCAPLGIALLDVETGAVGALAPFENGQMINPQFSPDGKELYFLANPDGFQDVYAVPLAGGAPRRITRTATGVSGITSASPALSVSRTGSAVFSVFDEATYYLHAFDAENGAPGAPADSAEASFAAALLPPAEKHGTGAVHAALIDGDNGLPDASGFIVSPYRPTLKLDYVTSVSLGVSSGRYGTSVSGGANTLFSDMLGNRVLGVSMFVSTPFKDSGFDVFYLNRRNRINWAVEGSRIPYLSASLSVTQAEAEVEGVSLPAVEYGQQVDIIRSDSLGFIVAYPFSSISRVETGVGFRYVSFESTFQRTLIAGGRVVSDAFESIPAPSPLQLFPFSVALVADNSDYGFSSPMKGYRSMLKVEPTTGSLSFFSLSADYRRYFFTGACTFAFRALHYGHYGMDAENSRLPALFLGYGAYVRGYELDSFLLTNTMSLINSRSPYPELNRLMGSRIGVLNAEVRLPLFGTKHYGVLGGGFVPVELAGFVDGGVAWTSHSHPALVFSRESAERIPVFSAGITSRFTIGYIVFEFYYAYPFQRTDELGHFGFQILPGW